MKTASVIALGLVLLSRHCYAQAVQIPVVSQFGVRTSVMVPDRGGTYLGGVKRAFDSRSQAGGLGPFRFGSSVGRELSHTGMSAHVFIHDLQEMDRMLLDAADSGTVPSELDVAPVWQLPGEGRYRRPGYVRSSSRYGVLGRSVLGTGASTSRWGERRPAVRENGGLSRATPNTAVASRTTKSKRVRNPTLNGARSYRLGQKAEADNRRGLAILHYQTAAQNGSSLARQRLAELGVEPIRPKSSLRFSKAKN